MVRGVLSFHAWCLGLVYLYGIQESPTLDLANDCFRFVTGYSEVINASAPHIYHSAIVFAPQKSIVRELYQSHARPFARVVHGLPMSWGTSIAATTRPSRVEVAAWSPCNRFIAISLFRAPTVDILDSVTLQRHRTVELLRAQDMDLICWALAFSPDGRILTSLSTDYYDRGLIVVISWDLQTGGVAGVIKWKGPDYIVAPVMPSITHSANGNMIGVRCRYSVDGYTILVFDVASGVYMHSHSPTSSTPHANGIWTHGESLRFITVGVKAITIWELGFTSYAIPTEVETLPAPEDIDFRSFYSWWDEDRTAEYIQFLPTPCRLALVWFGKVKVWDVQNSKSLLDCKDTYFEPDMSFSSDGRFFACSTSGADVYLWKESPTGYILHEILVCKTLPSRPLLSQNGESIVVIGSPKIRLWRMKDFITPPSSFLTHTRHLTREFVLGFSPDGMFAAVAMLEEGTVTVINLKSGVPQLTIETDMVVCGLRVIGNTVTVIGYWNAVTWDLPTGDHTRDGKATPKDSVRTIKFNRVIACDLGSATISPDFRYVVFTTKQPMDSEPINIPGMAGPLHIYDGSTGKELAQTRRIPPFCSTPFFAPGGCDLWLVNNGGCGDVFRVGSGGQILQDLGCGDVFDDGSPARQLLRALNRGDVFNVGGGGQILQNLKRKVDIGHPPEGYPWASSHGYQVMNDWWILGPDGQRLLMLPPAWQSLVAVRRVWKGQFLALLHCGLPEPVILELNQ